MALSGMKGKVFINPGPCDTSGSSTSGAPNGGDQVTQFVIEDSVQIDEFGTDESDGWQDNCAGTRKVQITLEAMAGSGTRLIYAGQVVSLELYSFGMECGNPASGNATVQRISYTTDIRTGKPVSYTATLASKGSWSGLGEGKWGGFECGCEDDTGDVSSSS